MKAWEMEREIRDNAVPKDRRKNESHWYKSDMTVPYGDELIKNFGNPMYRVLWHPKFLILK
jgi:hypothetical protein